MAEAEVFPFILWICLFRHSAFVFPPTGFKKGGSKLVMISPNLIEGGKIGRVNISMIFK